METRHHPPTDFYCSQLALENEEQMAGTAVSAPVWVLLEYRQLWQARATEENTLPASVKKWLKEQLGMVNGRLQFIRQTPYQQRYRCFVAVPDAHFPRLYRFDFAEYEELLNIDLTAIVSGKTQYTPYLIANPLFLVCTNGKRDRCCAKFGTALYQAFSEVAGTAVWQTTHLGGHRFAPTLMSFPEGVCYGQFSHDDILPLITAQQNNELYLPKLRGRASYSPIIQIAEYYLCQEISNNGLTAFKHIATESLSETTSMIEFQEIENNQSHRVYITEGRPTISHASCGSSKTKSFPTYLLKQIVKTN